RPAEPVEPGNFHKKKVFVKNRVITMTKKIKRFPVEPVEPEDFRKKKDFIKNRVITVTKKIKRFPDLQDPGPKDLEILRFTMAWMDLREPHRLQQHQ
ncbi:hypothetical protein M9458_004482, partial [Cirrhinus mrigala]